MHVKKPVHNSLRPLGRAVILHSRNKNRIFNGGLFRRGMDFRNRFLRQLLEGAVLRHDRAPYPLANHSDCAADIFYGASH